MEKAAKYNGYWRLKSIKQLQCQVNKSPKKNAECVAIDDYDSSKVVTPSWIGRGVESSLWGKISEAKPGSKVDVAEKNLLGKAQFTKAKPGPKVYVTKKEPLGPDLNVLAKAT